MEYAKLGTTDIKISRICAGCMSFGANNVGFLDWTLDAEKSEKIIARTIELGINFFDTANGYSAGTSEEYVARAMKNLGVARDKIVLATKVYFNEGKLSRAAILREIDGSLKRLATDYVDLYIVHRFDYDTPIEETMETLDGLVKAGKVRALGASSMFGYQFHNMQVAAEKNGWTKFVSMQDHYNLLYREDEREVIPICRQYGVSLTPYSPLASGRLSRLEWHTDSVRSKTDKVAIRKYDSTEAQDSKIVASVASVAQKHGATMSQIAIAWLLAKGVASPVVGVSKLAHMEEAAAAVDVKLSADDIAALEANYVPHKVMGPY